MLERIGLLFESRLRKKVTSADKTSSFISSNLVKRYFHKYQLLKLRRSVKYSYENSPFYHKLFKKSNISPSDIKSFADMKRIPFTDYNDLDNTKDFFAVPEANFVKVFSSSGTTSEPKMIYFTQKDLNMQISGTATGLPILYDITPEDRVRITYDHGYGTDDWGVRYCLERAFGIIGAMSILTGTRLSAEKELELFNNYKVTVLMGTPSYLHNLSCDLEHLVDLKKFKLKNILTGTEPLPSPIRGNLQKMWDTKVYQGYGLTEMGTSIAGECKMQNGMHITESDFYGEIVDPKTGEILEDGEIGELVFSTLSREGMPLLRYRTHDLGLIIPDKCRCGLPFKRIKIKSRTDKMVTIGSGDNIYPTAFDNVIHNITGLIDYQIELTRKNNKDHLTVYIESKSSDEKLKQKVNDALMSLPEIRNGIYESKTIEQPEIKIVKPHTIDRNGVKAKKIIDKRNLYE